MSARELDVLRERLLVAGVAPRHVRRYLRELGEHLDDARRAEHARGLDAAAAERAAWERLGSDDSLVQSVLEQPRLRSRAARFPALVFGAGPALAWLALVVATVAGLILVPKGASAPPPSAAWLEVARAIALLYLRALPVALCVIAFGLAAQRRLRLHSPLAGAVLLDILAGTLSVHIDAPASSRSALLVDSSLLPWLAPFADDLGPRSLFALSQGLCWALGMLVASAVLYRASAQRWSGQPRHP